jgi:hypothetical protein
MYEYPYAIMKTAVLVPSHISYDDQLERLDTCLESLSSQSVVPDIFVSISFANDTYKRNFAALLRKYPSVKFKLSPQQRFQMEHLQILSLLVTDYDMVMFCDDDDTYGEERVEKFVNTVEDMKRHCNVVGSKFGGVLEVKNANVGDGPAEYWSYGIPPSLLTEFFNRCKGYQDLLRHKFADMYLRDYLNNLGIKHIEFGKILPDIEGVSSSYNYTIDNQNSICGTTQSVSTILRNNLTLCIICNRDDLLREQMMKASIPLSRLHEVVPDAHRIIELTKILYK